MISSKAAYLPQRPNTKLTRGLAAHLGAYSDLEREELEADRQRRRRSYVELDVTGDQSAERQPSLPLPITVRSASIDDTEAPSTSLSNSQRSPASSSAFSELPSVWREKPQKTNSPLVSQDSSTLSQPFLSTATHSSLSLHSQALQSGQQLPAELSRRSVDKAREGHQPIEDCPSCVPDKIDYAFFEKGSIDKYIPLINQGQVASFGLRSPGKAQGIARSDSQLLTAALQDPHRTPTAEAREGMGGGGRAVSPLPEDAGGASGSSSKWKLPFGRKSSNKNSKKGIEDNWDDYQRGNVSAFDNTRAGNDTKLMAMLGLESDQRSGRDPRDIVADLRETGYLAPTSAPRTGNRTNKTDKLMGIEPTAHPPRLPAASRSSSLSMRSEPSSVPSPGPVHNESNNMSADCPVCLEPLSYRLAGEKPHVVPNCGHALHNACFTAVYGQPEAVMASQHSGAGPPGMCGVCRKAIFLGGEIEGGGKSSKAAGMMGAEGAAPARRLHGGHDQQGSDGRDPAGDDPIETLRRVDQSSSNLHSPGGFSTAAFTRSEASSRHGMVHPMIKVKSEYSTMYRKDPTGHNGRQNMVCVVSVEVPSRRPPPSEEEQENKHRIQWRALGSALAMEADGLSEDTSMQTIGSNMDDEQQRHKTPQEQRSYSPQPVSAGLRTHPGAAGSVSRSVEEYDDDESTTAYGGFREGAKESESSHQYHSTGQADDADTSDELDDEGFSFGATPAASQGGSSDPHAAVLTDLRDRIADWKGQTIERFGSLVLYDYLGVRQDAIVRNFWVYLFDDALLCVTEERKKERGLARLMSTNNGSTSQDKSAGRNSDVSVHPPSTGPKPALKLKGRIWLRHISRVEESSSGGSLSLSIQLDDESLDHFILCFSERPMLDLWRVKLMQLVSRHKPQQPASSNGRTGITTSTTKSGAREMTQSYSANDSLGLDSSTAGSGVARRSTTGSVMSGKSGSTAASTGPHHLSPSISSGNVATTPSAKNVVENLRRASKLYTAGSAGVPTEQQWSASGGLDPSLPPPPMLPHTPLDLIIMVSVPVVVQQQQQSGISSSAALKLRLIRSTLEFVASSLGRRDRLSIVAFTSGHNGEVRRTALLSVDRPNSRQRLADFIEGIGRPWTGAQEDPFRVDSNKLGGASERTDTVTALNVGLDVVLGRKSKNPCTGMLLINDTSDGPVRGQMDLVMARAEAANVPIHCFGFGKSSNPSSLWLVSNHTRGSYTFVKEWYQLRECVAGCVGSLMSIALDNFKLYISVPSDNHFKVRKVSGPTGAIISASGKEVDVELGELRFGEVRELFVELEVDFNGLVPFIAETNGAGRGSLRRLQNAPAIEQGSATDDFMQRMGLQDLSLNSSDNADGLFDVDADAMNNLIEEVAVFEVDAGYRDPSSGNSLARISNPTVLTIEVDAHTLESSIQNRTADPVVTRRRIEILVSEMITRSLLLVSRKNYSQALRIINETHKIVETVLRALSMDESLGFSQHVSASGSRRFSAETDHSSPAKRGASGLTPSRSAPSRQRMIFHRHAIASLLAILDDLELIAGGLETGLRPQFDRDGRNSAAQQAMILRDQEAWTTRTATEALRFLGDNGPAFAAQAFASSRA